MTIFSYFCVIVVQCSAHLVIIGIRLRYLVQGSSESLESFAGGIRSNSAVCAARWCLAAIRGPALETTKLGADNLVWERRLATWRRGGRLFECRVERSWPWNFCCQNFASLACSGPSARSTTATIANSSNLNSQNALAASAAARAARDGSAAARAHPLPVFGSPH